MSQRTHYILVDYENVQPRSWEALNGFPFKLYLFVGTNQTKVPIELAASLQSLGEKAEYIRIDGSGRNALDFHIAYYLGVLAERDPDGYFHVISKDTGFDPLVRHLKAKKILAGRAKDLLEMPILRISNTKTPEEKLAAVVKYLEGRGPARPRKVKTLRNAINAHFQKTLEEAELDKLVAELVRKQLVIVDGEKVSYELASS
jgi:hypothetical protein